MSFLSKRIEQIRHRMRKSWLLRWALCMVVLLMLLGAGGLITVASGIVPIKASSGHWAITHMFLQFAKERSVSTHTLGITPPPLDDRALIVKGAGHYEIGCSPCHGSPELPHRKIVRHMLPPPPYLSEIIPNWEPEELFFMVKHGIKFTGIPAWPSQQRDDEVWAVVAFLQRFPELDIAEYRKLVSGENITSPQTDPLTVPLSSLKPATTFDLLIKNCNPCHGSDGQGRDVAAFPKLAGQRPEYFVASMEAYARGERHSGIMQPIAASLSSKQFVELSLHYALLPQTSSPPNEIEPSIQRGEVIALKGIPENEVPACAACHDPKSSRPNPSYPSLNGQFADYIKLQLSLFKNDKRGGTVREHLMRNAVAGLNDEQMQDVANYFASRNAR